MSYGIPYNKVEPVKFIPTMRFWSVGVATKCEEEVSRMRE
jgi:hypothetical protein